LHTDRFRREAGSVGQVWQFSERRQWCAPIPRRRPAGTGPTVLKDGPMAYVQGFDHVGITVADLDAVTAFFVGLGLEVEGTWMFVEGEFLDAIIGIPDSCTEIVMLRPPDGGTRLELSSFVRPDHEPGSHAAMANELGVAQRGLSSR
jgi:hypothetical protein